MRHVFASGPILTGPRGMMDPAPPAGLVTPSRSTLRLASRLPGAITGAINLAAVATPADDDLIAAAST